MKTTIDRSGRLVIPHALRAQIGLADGGEVDVAVHGAAILIEPLSGLGLQKEGDLLVIPAAGRALDDDAIRALRLADQR
jgi:AbrB family looped-hinge helix DNA binding protein